MNETKILLGDEVKCKYTGLKGVVMSKIEFINGCVQFGVVQKHKPDQPLLDAMAEISIDEQNLVVTKKGERHIEAKEEERTGGAMRLYRRR